MIACGFGDLVQLLIADSVSAAALFGDESIGLGAHRCQHDYYSVVADIEAWAPKVAESDVPLRCAQRLSPMFRFAALSG